MERFGLTSDELRNLILSVGRGGHRVGRPLTPVEVASTIQKMTNHGATTKDCAEIAGFEGTSMVARFLKLLDLDPAIRHYVDWGQTSAACIGFSAAWELSRLPREDQDFACRAILEHQFKGSEVRDLVQLRQRSGKNIQDCIDQIVRLRPRVVKRYMFVGSVTDQALCDSLRAMTQNSRDQIFGQIVKGLCPSALDANGRLGADRFSVVGDATLNDCMRSVGDDFETSINEALKARLSNNV
jgi:hypothetical protein